MKKLLLLLSLLSVPLFAQSADVRVFSQSGRTTLPGGEVADVTLAFFNAGPDVARNVRIEIRATAGARLDRVFAENCSTAGNVVTCSYGDLAAGAPAQFAGANYRLPLGEATHAITTTITSDTPDPDTTNNVASTQFTTTRPPAIFAALWPVSARVDPGQRFTFEARIREEQQVPEGTRVDVRWSLPRGTIETIEAPSSWTCSNAGSSAQCTFAAPAGEFETAKITIRASENRTAGSTTLHTEAVAQIEGRDAPGRGDAELQVYRHIVVTTNADAGPGSLRDAVDEANANCSPGPCRMLFALTAPAEIVPATPLPPLRTDRIVIDAMASPVVIDGRVAGEGLEVHAGCDAVVRGLTLRNFNGNQGLWFTWERRACQSGPHDAFLVEHNTLESNLRGLRLDGAPRPVVRSNVIRDNRYSGIWMWHGAVGLLENEILNNGASGVFLGPQTGTATLLRNRISGHPHMGVAVAYGARDVEIRGNSIRGNLGLAIDWGLDSTSAPNDDDQNTHGNAPVILSALYDASRNITVVTVAMRTRRLAQVGGVDLELFADGEPVAMDVSAPFEGTHVVTLPGDLRGKTITATASRWIDFSELGNTSEISTGVNVH